jgi:hypothetical protein
MPAPCHDDHHRDIDGDNHASRAELQACTAAGLEIEWADGADVVPVPTPLQPSRPTLCGEACVCCNVGHG